MKFHFREPDDDDTLPWLISDDAGNDIAHVFSDENSTVKATREESIAIARLFAAAPKMLATLKAAAGYLMNAKIGLTAGGTKQTAIATIDGGLKLINETISEVERNEKA